MGKLRWIWVTLLPAAALVIVTMTASYEKIFSADPRLGFLSAANQMSAAMASGSIASAKIADTSRLIFNQRLDAAITAILALMVMALVVNALYEWARILTGAAKPQLHEAPNLPTRWAEGD